LSSNLSPSAPRKIYDFSGNPPDPFPLIREGGVWVREGLCPSLESLPIILRIHLPIMERDKKEESKRGEASKYIIGSFRGTKSL